MRLEMNDYDPKVQTPRQTGVRFQDYKSTGAAVAEASEVATAALTKMTRAWEELGATELLQETEQGIEAELDDLRKSGVDAMAFRAKGQDIIRRRLADAEERQSIHVDRDVKINYQKGLGRIGLSRSVAHGDESDQRTMDEGRAKFVKRLDYLKRHTATADPSFVSDPTQAEFSERLKDVRGHLENQRNKFLTNQEVDKLLIETTDEVMFDRVREFIRTAPDQWAEIIDGKHPASGMAQQLTPAKREQLREYGRSQQRQAAYEADRKYKLDQRELQQRQESGWTTTDGAYVPGLNALYVQAAAGNDITDAVLKHPLLNSTQKNWLLDEQRTMRERDRTDLLRGREELPSRPEVKSYFAVAAELGEFVDAEDVRPVTSKDFREAVADQVNEGNLSHGDAAALITRFEATSQTRKDRGTTIYDKQVSHGREILKDGLGLLGDPSFIEKFSYVKPETRAQLEIAKSATMYEYIRHTEAKRNDPDFKPFEYAEKLRTELLRRNSNLVEAEILKIADKYGIKDYPDLLAKVKSGEIPVAEGEALVQAAAAIMEPLYREPTKPRAVTPKKETPPAKGREPAPAEGWWERGKKWFNEMLPQRRGSGRTPSQSLPSEKEAK